MLEGKRLHYQIVGQGDQVLQILFNRNQDIYLGNCDIIYGSQGLFSKARELLALNTFGLKSLAVFKKLKNTSDYPEYLGIRRGNGKILCLNHHLYKDMMIDTRKLLAMTYEHDINKESQHNLLVQFKCYSPLHPNQDNMVFLQADSSTFIEKQLAQGQKIMTNDESLLSFSKSVKVTKTKNEILLQGPGFVFFTLGPTSKRRFTIWSLVYIILFLVVLELLFMNMMEIMDT